MFTKQYTNEDFKLVVKKDNRHNNRHNWSSKFVWTSGTYDNYRRNKPKPFWFVPALSDVHHLDIYSKLHRISKLR